MSPLPLGASRDRRQPGRGVIPVIRPTLWTISRVRRSPLRTPRSVPTAPSPVASRSTPAVKDSEATSRRLRELLAVLDNPGAGPGDRPGIFPAVQALLAY